MRSKQIILLLLVGLCVACSKRTVYSEYQNLPVTGWEADSAVHFTFCITDTLATYDVLIHLRHTQRYPYQNMWLFIDEVTPTLSKSDTIEFYLADQRGQWLGNGWGNLREMPVLYKQRATFPAAGEYTYTIHQGMREDCLRGVNDIGLTIEYNK